MKRYGFLVSCIILACGIIWSNLAIAKDAACPPRVDCRTSKVLAKRVDSKEPYCFSCSKKCTEAGCDDLIIRMKRRVTLNSKETLCDEAIQCIPPGSILDVDLTYHIRQAGPCGKPVGTHEGTFRIYGPPPAGALIGTLIGSGRMHGTNGLETHVDTQECCAWPHDEGCLDGTVRCTSGTANVVASCKLLATYASGLDAQPIDPANPCDVNNWTHWTLNIDGIVQCRCTK